MMKLTGVMVIPLTLSIFMCCWASELASPPTWTSEPLKILDGYGLAPWSYGGYALIGTLSESGDRYAIVSDIESIGWNDDFIVVEAKITKRRWYIFDVSNRKNYKCDENSPFADKCNSFEEFQLLKKEIGVPETLVMQDVKQAYEELNKKQE
jgi:hypothetical protein